jgi:hypothetical protein
MTSVFKVSELHTTSLQLSHLYPMRVAPDRCVAPPDTPRCPLSRQQPPFRPTSRPPSQPTAEIDLTDDNDEPEPSPAAFSMPAPQVRMEHARTCVSRQSQAL